MSLVLVVEDDPDTRLIESCVLGYAGHEVLLAANGRDAIELLGRYRPSVIVLDLMMPVMDGLTFLAECRARGLAQAVPIVCVTAGGEEMRKHALALGAHACFPKPTDFDDLCEQVNRYCSSTAPS